MASKFTEELEQDKVLAGAKEYFEKAYPDKKWGDGILFELFTYNNVAN